MGTASATPANLFAYSAATDQAARELEAFVRGRVTPLMEAYSQEQSCPIPVDAMVLSRLRAIVATDAWVKEVGQAFVQAGGGGAAGLLAPGRRVVTTDDALASATAALAVQDYRQIVQGYPGDQVGAEAALARLNALMGDNRGDSAFSASLLQQMGPQGMLNLLAKLSALGHYDHSKGGLPQVVTAQHGLSALLATATDPSSPHHLDPGWSQQLDKLGGHAFAVTPTMDMAGYQLLEPLLSDPGSHFSTPFLTTIGHGLLAYERNSPGGKAPWAAPLMQGPRPNLITPGDAGYDPMAGLLAALGRNPEAATALLDPRGGKDSTLEYLLAKRGWPCDTGGSHAGQSALADALRAGAGSHPSDAAQRRIAASMVQVLALDFGGKTPPPLQGGVTDVLSAHIAAGNVNGAFSGAAGGDHTAFTRLYLLMVLGDLGGDPQRYQHLSAVESAYARLHFGADPEMTAPSMGMVFGALAHGRVMAEKSGHLSADARHNAKVKMVSWAVDQALALVPAKGAAGYGMQAVQHLASQIEQHAMQDTSGQATKEADKIYGEGQNNVSDAAQQLAASELHGQKQRIEALGAKASDGFDSGYRLAAGAPSE